MRSVIIVLGVMLVSLAFIAQAGNETKILVGKGQDPNEAGITSVFDRTITYQGILRNSSGNPVPDNNYSITFRIYRQSSGGSAIWNSGALSVATHGGLFSAELGPLNLPFDTTYFLSVQVQGDTEMARQKMTMVPYAAVSDTANYAKSGSGNWTVSNGVIYTNSTWGIARGGAGNVLLGANVNTMVNLGTTCTTGTEGQNWLYCTIGGGQDNVAAGENATVAGGASNAARELCSTVGGGAFNQANGGASTIAGGDHNIANGYHAFVGGGNFNTVNYDYSAVVGGDHNFADGYNSFIGAGYADTITQYCGVIGGGRYNYIAGHSGFIGGGEYNYISGQYGTISGGDRDTVNAVFGGIASGHGNEAGNVASDTGAFVGGGWNNHAFGKYSSVLGGIDNYTGPYSYGSSVIGGRDNIADGDCSVACGWHSSTALSGNYSFAGGYRSKADHSGCFVWSDASLGHDDLATTAPNQYLVRATGGMHVYGEVSSHANGVDYYMVPKGAIIMWSGQINDIPDGWALCDGNYGTPDLRDRFIYGCQTGENPGATSGSINHTHDLITDWIAVSPGLIPVPLGNAFTTEQADNLPPYYKLAFIMKL